MSIESSQSFLQSYAEDTLSRAQSMANRIGSFTPGSTKVNFNYDPSSPNIDDVPTIGELLPSDTSASTVAFLNEQTDKWMDRYFPNLSSCSKYSAEEWACGVLTGDDPLNLNREAFEETWRMARDQAFKQSSSEKAQIRADFSANRGFTIPQGAMMGAMINAEVRASNAIAEVNRAEAIRETQIKLDLVKYAVSVSAQLKMGMLQALASFYNQWVGVLDRDTDLAAARARAYDSLTSALANQYRVELGWEELRYKAAAGKASAEEATNRMMLQEGDVRASMNAAVASAADAFAKASSAAANAQSSFQAELYTGATSS